MIWTNNRWTPRLRVSKKASGRAQQTKAQRRKKTRR
jgi:hypothetical protein